MSQNQPSRFASMTAPGLECALLSCAMQAPDAVIPRLQGVITVDDFSPGSFHRDLYALITERYGAGLLCDLPCLTQALMDAGKLTDATGGSARLVEIYTSGDGLPASAAGYALAIREKAAQRRLMAAADAFQNVMIADCTDWKDHTAALVEAVLKEQASGSERAKIVPIKTAIMEAVEELGEAVQNRGHVTHGFATGFTALDRMFMGLRRTQNVVIAGRPSMGKTALAVNILENFSMGCGDYREFYLDAKEWPACKRPRQGQLPTLLVCLESSQIEMASRMLCGRARVSIQRIRDGLMGANDIQRISRTSQEIGGSPMHIWDAAGVTVEELELELKAFKARVPDLAAVCVDHCGLLGARGVKDAGDDTAKFSYVSNRLRLLWKQLDVLGLPLWQLNRGVEKRSDARPKLSDIRSSGKIEEDASQVIMPYRPFYYDNDQPEDEAYLVVCKNRGGPTNAEGVKVKWEAEFTRFSSLQSRLFSNKDEEQQENF